MKIKKLTYMAMLSAIAMIVFVIEAQIPVPIPLPGVKLGLSNVITLFALWALGWREAGVILLIRVFLGNLLVAQMMAFFYSLAGGLLCWTVICLLKPLFHERQIWILSIFGALAHNIGQLAIAVYLTETPQILTYAPVLLLCGLITGFFTGQCAQAAVLHMKKISPH